MANIVGISAYYHDSACCLMVNGKLVAAAEEERFTRKKHDKDFPAQAFHYCLEEAGLSIADVDCVAFYEDSKKKLSRQIWMGIRPQASSIVKKAAANQLMAVGRFERDIRDFGYQGKIESFDHHYSHAASSFYFSGFKESAILTVDGVGEWATTTYGQAVGSKVELFEEVQFPNSLGLLYSTITSYLGFDVNNSEYKVMGLAPYGKPRYADQIWELIKSEDGGTYKLNLDFFDFLSSNRMYSDALVQLFGKPAREQDSEITTFHKDIACSLQTVLEEMLLKKVRYLYSRVPSNNLCMAGGVALNCVANGRILREGPFSQLFVQPAASDAGGALGAAALAHVRLTGKRPDDIQLLDTYLGPSFSSKEIGKLLQSTSAEIQHFPEHSKLFNEVVDRLCDGKVVGWFSGRMEFGPRALGARSILADPRKPDMRDRINALVKKRESFRPFAPAVLARKASEHFDIDHTSPFMLETCKVISKLDLPAITHVNGSARIQTVDLKTSPYFGALLECFDERTGCPILLNTSFNMRGEPIVCTPIDAVICFVRSGIDALVLEDFIFDRTQIPQLWNLFVSMMPVGREQAVSRSVYTML